MQRYTLNVKRLRERESHDWKQLHSRQIATFGLEHGITGSVGLRPLVGLAVRTCAPRLLSREGLRRIASIHPHFQTSTPERSVHSGDRVQAEFVSSARRGDAALW